MNNGRMHWLTKGWGGKWVAMLALLWLSAFSMPVHAKQVLVLFTGESAADGIQMIQNCRTEFVQWARKTNLANGNTDNKVFFLGSNGVAFEADASWTNTTPAATGYSYLNDTTPMTAAQLFPPTGSAPYDIIATCTVYKQALPATVGVINDAMKNRTARTFLHFDEIRAFQDGWINAKTDWAVSYNGASTFPGSGAAVQTLNPQNKYKNAFPATIPGWYFTTYGGVPMNNALYTLNTQVPAAGDTVAKAVSFIVVPLSESYMGANGVAQGACIFSSTDVSMFDSVRYPAYNANAGMLLAKKFIDAAEPGGPCNPLPSITKSFSPAVVNPGQTSTLTIQVKNNGGYTDSQGVFHPAAPATGMQLLDNLPAPLVLAEPPTSTCGATPTGNAGDSSLSIQNGTLPPDTCTITAKVQWPQTNNCSVASVTNRIVYGNQFGTDAGPTYGQAPTLTGGAGDATANLTCRTAPVPMISVTKTANVDTVVPGGAVVFTVVVANTGTVDATGVTLTDAQTADWTGFSTTCQTSSGGTCAGYTGSINATGLTVPAQGSLTYTITANATGNNPSAVNTATVTPGNGLCVDGTTSCASSARVNVSAPITVAKTLTAQSANPAVPGSTLTYSVVLSNPSGVIPVQHPITLSDPLPQGVSAGTWTCVTSATNPCSTYLSTTNGTLPMNLTVPGLATSTSLTFTVVATVDPQNRQYSPVVNTATATPTAPDLCVGGKTSCSASVSTPVNLPGSVTITKTLTSAAVVQ